MKRASSSMCIATAAATSCALAMRPIGVSATVRSRMCADLPAVALVSTRPGEITFTVMPCGPNSWAMTGQTGSAPPWPSRVRSSPG